MEALRHGVRANRVHFRPGDDEWNIDLTFQLEKKCIYEEMERVAGNLQSQKGLEVASAYADTMMDSIRNSYTTYTDPPTHIWKKALQNELKDECPKRSSVLGFRIAFWIALLAEVVVMGVQAALSGEINPFIFVLAFILGLGGFFQGLGVGNLFFVKWKNRTGRPHDAPLTRDWVLVSLGTVLILLVAAVRGSGGSNISEFLLVFLITLFFGEAVAICEASAVDLSRQRDQCKEDMANCQQVQASQQHSKNLDEQVYRRDFDVFVRHAATQKYQRNPDLAGTPSSEPAAFQTT